MQFEMVDDKHVMNQVHEYENLVANVLCEGMKMCEMLLEKFPPPWSDYRNQLKHKKKDKTLQELISHMKTEEANRLKDNKVLSPLFLLKLTLLDMLVLLKTGLKERERNFINMGIKKRQTK